MVGVYLAVLCFIGEIFYFIHSVLLMFYKSYIRAKGLFLELRQVLLKIHD